MNPPFPPPSPHFPPQRPVFGTTPPAPLASVPPSSVAAGHSDAIEVGDSDFAKIVEGANPALPVLVECWADWCATCKLLLPTVQLLARELQGKAVICTLNSDLNPALASKLQLQSMPTILIYKAGQLVSRVYGMQTKGKLLEALRQAGMA